MFIICHFHLMFIPILSTHTRVEKWLYVPERLGKAYWPYKKPKYRTFISGLIPWCSDCQRCGKILGLELLAWQNINGFREFPVFLPPIMFLALNVMFFFISIKFRFQWYITWLYFENLKKNRKPCVLPTITIPRDKRWIFSEINQKWLLTSFLMSLYLKKLYTFWIDEIDIPAYPD